MMKIERVDSLSSADVAACDFSLDVTCEALAPFDGDALGKVAAVTPYRKSYEFKERPLVGGSASRDCFLAVAKDGDQVRAYVLAAATWNNCAQIEDFAVDRSSRRQGIGRLLMNAVLDWAKEVGLPIVRLETQSNNVPACHFYQRYGFRLGGFDRHLYDALALERPETALFWYLFVEDGERQ